MRMKIIKDVLSFLMERFEDGIQMFDCRNLVGDYLYQIYDKDGVMIEFAPEYDYIEIFGLRETEFEFVQKIWDCSFGNEINRDWRKLVEEND